MNQNLIVKMFDGSKVFFMEDGWFNFSKSAKIFGKKATHWLIMDETLEYAVALAKSLNLFNSSLERQLSMIQTCDNQIIRRTKTLQFLQELGLVKTKAGAPSTGGGTWLHPKLAIPSSRWLAVEFAIWCDDQIEQIIHQQQQTSQQKHIQQILDLLYQPVNLMSFEQISLSDRLAQRRFTWQEFQEFFGMKRNTWFLRVIVGIINRQVLGISAGQFRRQILGPNQFRMIDGIWTRQEVDTNNLPNNLTKDFLPKPHQECIQSIMQDLLDYFIVRPGWSKDQVRVKTQEFIHTRKGNMEILIGRNLHELLQECIFQIAEYSRIHEISPYDVINQNLIQLNYNQLALEREIRQQQLRRI